MKKTAVYAGTFDPATNGHLDLIKRASALSDSLIVAVGENPKKKAFFPLKKRIELLQECTKNIPNARVEPFSGLLVDFARKKKARVLVRGLRELSDFEAEFQQATINRRLAPEIETVLVITDAKFFYLNSTIVKELASFNAKISDFVPAPIEKSLRLKLSQNTANSK